MASCKFPMIFELTLNGGEKSAYLSCCVGKGQESGAKFAVVAQTSDCNFVIFLNKMHFDFFILFEVTNQIKKQMRNLITRRARFRLLYFRTKYHMKIINTIFISGLF